MRKQNTSHEFRKMFVCVFAEILRICTCERNQNRLSILSGLTDIVGVRDIVGVTDVVGVSDVAGVTDIVGVTENVGVSAPRAPLII